MLISNEIDEKTIREEQDQFEYECIIADVVFYVKQRGWDTVLTDILNARNLQSKYAKQNIKQYSPF
jgi:hypothetical protein